MCLLWGCGACTNCHLHVAYALATRVLDPQCTQTPVKAVNDTDPINKWARDKTGGRITQSVPPATPFDLVITNAVYFRCAICSSTLANLP
jgi:serine protease inhibitor